MTDKMQKLHKLANGTATARWAADKIRDLEIRLHKISGILHGDTMYPYVDICEMRELCNTEVDYDKDDSGSRTSW